MKASSPAPQRGSGYMVPYPPSDAMTKQPVAVCTTSVYNPKYMPVPSGQFSCPPGLEYLTMIDQLLVHQQVERLEVLSHFETSNLYTIKNSMGEIIYHAAEVAECCDPICYGSVRPFELKIIDYRGMEVIHISRELNCYSCCFPCCSQKIFVTAPPGTLLGSIEDDWTCIAPTYYVKDPTRKTLFKVEGSACICCGVTEFKVLLTDGKVIGNISKQGSELVKEVFTDANYFGITFPSDLSVHHKVLLLGALFLIDFTFYEIS